MTKQRIIFLLGSFLLVALGLLTVHSYPPKRPNFIIILADDHRYDALGVVGNPHVFTPHLDSLGRAGMHFSNACVTLSICSPSRAALLTGQYGSRNGVTKLSQAIRPGTPTLAQVLRQTGYQTAVVGKWHLENTPQSLGFEQASCFKSNGAYYNRPVSENGQNKVVKGFIEDYIAGQATAFLERMSRREEPFLLFYNTQLPHMNERLDWDVQPATLSRYDAVSITSPPNWADDLSTKPPYLKSSRSRTQALNYGYARRDSVERHIRRYYSAITEMDAALGKALRRVRDLGLAENTYIIYLGDNGWLLGEHGLTSKVLAYEESMRIPMLMSGPGIQAGSRNASLALNVDVMPTILSLAGAAVPRPVQGISLVPQLRGQKTSQRTSQFYEALTPELGSWPILALRTERYKYIQTFALANPANLVYEELYDLRQDPGELRNLAQAANHRTVKEKLTVQLQQQRAATQSP
ncbi:MAG: sulfatase-like hydrolase/transferase [Bacteroidetes bacterium]|nr:sulfatase-like hydrolase/transferase [Fibrella sp.]